MGSSKAGFGIDYGTTNSVAAMTELATGRTEVLTTDGRPHPSVVWFRADDTVCVGREAKRNINRYSEEVGNCFVPSIKRKLGKGHAYKIFGQARTAADIATEVFKHILKRSEVEKGIGIRDAVVTVPVYFDGRARRELRRAADRAGLFIKTFIHEPFAAVVGFCCLGMDTKRLEQMEGKRILVFDWGGGTLDITVASVVNGHMTELATAGREDRAGDHFDDRIRHYATAQFLNQHRIAPTDLDPFASTKDRVLYECERAKIALSNKQEEDVQVAQAFRVDGRAYSIKERLTRNQFETLIRTDVKDAMIQVDLALETAQLESSDVDFVLLIGGSSLIPVLRLSMEERFGSRLIYVQNADTIIAEGASIIDAMDMLPEFARTIGIQLSDGCNYEIFRAGSIAKADVCRKKTNLFCTDNRDGQARLVITEEVSNTPRAKHILPIPVSSDLPKPFNHERVTVEFGIDDDLILHVSGKGATLDARASVEIHDLCFGLKIIGANG